MKRNPRAFAQEKPKALLRGAILGVLLLGLAACDELDHPFALDCSLHGSGTASATSGFPPELVAVPVADVKDRILPALAPAVETAPLAEALDDLRAALAAENPQRACAAFNNTASLVLDLSSEVEAGAGTQADIDVARLALSAVEVTLLSLVEN